MPTSGKRVRLSDDAGVTWWTLPGNTGEFQNEGQTIDDTIFGQLYRSGFPGLINWNASAQAFYKGFAGYQADIFQPGAATIANAEPMTLVSGKTYRTTDATHNLWDRTDPVVVYDNGVDHTADVLEIDYLFGQVTFLPAYTVTGPVTVDISWLAQTQVAGSRDYTLTMTMEAVDDTTMPIAQGNSGHRTFTDGLKTVELELSGVYALSNGFRAALVARSELIVEINPSGSATGARCRGFFRYTGQGQSGDVGALEEETVNLTLSVPDDPLLAFPFDWEFRAGHTLSNAVVIGLQAWLDGTIINAQYLPDGTTGLTGQCLISEMSMSGGLESMNEFSVGIQGTGQVSAVP